MKLIKHLFAAAALLTVTGCQTLDIPDPTGTLEEIKVAFDFDGKNIDLSSADGSNYNYTSTSLDSRHVIMTSELRMTDSPSGSPHSIKFDLLINIDSLDRVRSNYSHDLPGDYTAEPDSSGFDFRYSLDANLESHYPVNEITWQLLDAFGNVHSFHNEEELHDISLGAELIHVDLMANDIRGNQTQSFVLSSHPFNPSELLGRINYQIQDSLLIASVDNALSPYTLEINGFSMVDSSRTIYPLTGSDSIFTTYSNPATGELKFESFVYSALEHGQEAPAVSSQIRITDNSQPQPSERLIDDIVIQYVDENGVLWHSLPNGLPGFSVVIHSAETFVENEFGDQTILVEMIWSALMVDLQTGDVVLVEDALSNIAFALP